MGWGLEYRDGGGASPKIVVFLRGLPSRHYTNVVAERGKKRIIRPESDEDRDMKSDLLSQAQGLPIAERIELVEAIWDTIPENAGTDVLPLSEEHRAELERRLTDMEADPGVGRPWDEVRDRLARRR
jgi:putative addiction module component (TIGR02574 family)